MLSRSGDGSWVRRRKTTKTSVVSVELHTTHVVPIVNSLGMIVLFVSPSIVVVAHRLPMKDLTTLPQYSANANISSICIVYSNGSIRLLPNNNVPWIGDLGVSRTLKTLWGLGVHSS